MFDVLEIDRFRAGIARRLGLRFEESRWAFLAEVLQRRLDRTGLTGLVYLDRLDSRAAFADELRQLARELTVGETYFFRNIEQFRAVAELVFPARVAARAHTRVINILSAGCASGEETYTLAMLARDQNIDPRWTVSVLGIDVNPAALEKAAAARYSAWSLRETPADAQTRWFQTQGRDLLVDPTIRAAVKFEERNLTEENPTLWHPGTYDLVFCRNVLMYHTPEAAQAIVARIHRALAPGGYLFMGHAENLRGLSQGFHLCHTHGTFYYQRKEATDQIPSAGMGGFVLDDVWIAAGSALRRGAISAERVGDGVEGGAGGDQSGTWIDTIRRATDRIQLLARGEGQPPMGASSANANPTLMASPGEARARAGQRLPTPRPDLAPVIESLQRERFSEALGLWHALPSESVTDPEALLLRAALLTHSGQLDVAERVCAEVLAVDELNAGAHYLLALCREGAGDRASAIDHDQIAVYLDPAFAMPRLHMGLLARRAGQRDVARRELGLALPLLQREDTSRLLLFGGGFNRDTLAALCRAELSAAGAER
jgi:chemotaxis protein methyltransferase CheR